MKICENIYAITVGSLEVNCVIAVCPDTFKAVIFDPGDEAGIISEFIDSNRFLPVKIINTHCHYDHIGAIEELKRKYKIKLYIHQDEREYAENPEINYSAISGRSICVTPDVFFSDGDDIEFGKKQLKVIHTPGHTQGSCCFLIDNILISGDTLFAGSVGRTDLYGGSAERILRSVKEKLLILPGNTIVIPGHDRITSIGQERLFNPYF